MKVGETGFTPMHFQQTPSVKQARTDAFQQKIAEIDNEPVAHKTEKTDQTQTASVAELSKTQSTEQNNSAMSAYLNAEEKQMLNMLFPPVGRDMGVRAYRQVQTPVHHPDAIGNNIDILS